MSRFEGKVALVTGASEGIGAAIAARLVRDGAKVVIAARTEAKLVAAAKAIAAPDRVAWKVTDVCIQQQVENLVAFACERFGRLDFLVNNAGGGALTYIPETDPKAWHDTFDLTIHSVFYACRAAIPKIVAAGGGAIVNIASISGMFGDHGMGPYNAAKGAVINFTRTLAADHVSDGIRVNSVSPGLIQSASTGQMPETLRNEWFERCIPMGRWGKPEDIAAAVSFLLSSDAAFITGANLPVDGGATAINHQPNIPKIFGMR